MILVYTGIWFMPETGWCRNLVYTGLWFTQESGSRRHLAYTGIWFTQKSGFYCIPGAYGSV